MLCLVLNHLLDQQASSKALLQQEVGKVIALNISPLQVNLLVNDQGHFEVSKSSDNLTIQQPDTKIAMKWADLLGAVQSPSTMSRKAAVEGDVGFAQTVSTVINNLSWDSERDLARVIGDTQAVWLTSFLSALGTNARDVVQRFKSNLREYLVYEKAMVPTLSEWDAFRSDVNGLRDQLARLEKRMSKLDTKSGEL